jgi:hypothetical protein
MNQRQRNKLARVLAILAFFDMVWESIGRQVRFARQETALFLIRRARNIWPIQYSADVMLPAHLHDALESAELCP